MEEIARRVREAWERGATEVCMQGGIHPDYTGKHQERKALRDEPFAAINALPYVCWPHVHLSVWRSIGDTYLKVLRAAKDEEARIHVHAFSPLEVAQGAATLGKEV